jgi:ceramide glucosyltransferase
MFILIILSLICSTEEKVTIIKPITTFNEKLEESLESFFLTDYPHDICVCLQNTSTNVDRLSERLRQKYPHVKIFHNDNTPYLNPKINNINEAYEQAQTDLIWIADADIITSSDNLSCLVKAFISNQSVGLVHQVPISLNRSCLTEYVYFSTSHFRMYKLLNMLKFPCVSGKSILIRKSLIGDLSKFGHLIAEDHAIAEYLIRSKKTIVLSDKPCYMLNSNASFMSWFMRMVRWSRIRQNINFVTYLEPLIEPLVFCILIQSFELFVIWMIVDYLISQSLVNISFIEFVIGWFSREITCIIVYLTSITSRSVVWNNQRYSLRK